MGLLEGFIKSTAMILVSEIGDKTFFVAALMAMRYSRGIVFAGCHSALGLMTILSALFGWAAPNLIPRHWTHYAATSLFFLFGLRSLYDGFTHEGGESAELAEVEAHLQAEDKRDDNATAKSPKTKDGKKQQNSGLLSPIFLEAFSLTFLGEWGDRSQIATIGLAAQEDVLGVTLGGILYVSFSSTSAFYIRCNSSFCYTFNMIVSDYASLFQWSRIPWWEVVF